MQLRATLLLLTACVVVTSFVAFVTMTAHADKEDATSTSTAHRHTACGN